MALSTLVFSFGLSSGHHALISVIVLKIIVVDEAILVGLFNLFLFCRSHKPTKGVKSHNYCGTKAAFALVQSSK
jgi:hypothetical protein